MLILMLDGILLTSDHRWHRTKRLYSRLSRNSNIVLSWTTKQSDRPCWQSPLQWPRCVLRSVPLRLSARLGWSEAELFSQSTQRPTPSTDSHPAQNPPAVAAEPPAGPRDPPALAGRSDTERGHRVHGYIYII